MQRARHPKNWRYWASLPYDEDGVGKTYLQLYEEGMPLAAIWNILFPICARKVSGKWKNTHEPWSLPETEYLNQEQLMNRKAYWDMVYPAKSGTLQDKEDTFQRMGDLSLYEEKDEDINKII